MYIHDWLLRYSDEVLAASSMFMAGRWRMDFNFYTENEDIFLLQHFVEIQQIRV